MPRPTFTQYGWIQTFPPSCPLCEEELEGEECVTPDCDWVMPEPDYEEMMEDKRESRDSF